MQKIGIILTLSIFANIGSLFSQFHGEIESSFEFDKSNKEQKIESTIEFSENKKSILKSKNQKEYTKYSCKYYEGECLYWHENEHHNDIGIDILYWTSGFMLDTDDLQGYDGVNIQTFRIRRGDTPVSAILKIWQGTDNDNLTLKHEQCIFDDLQSGEWKDIELSELYTIDASQQLWVGVEWGEYGNGYFPSSYDHQDDGIRKGNFLKMGDGEWRNLSDYGYLGNWYQEVVTEDNDSLSWYHKNGVIIIGRIGLRSASWTSSIQFDTNDLSEYEDKTICKVNVFVNDMPFGATLKIWQGEDLDNLTEYHSQAITSNISANQWNEIILDNPYTIDNEENLFVGVVWSDPGKNINPAAFDRNTSASGKSNILRMYDGWQTLEQIDLEGDWLKDICLKTDTKFDKIGPFCIGETPRGLPDISKDGITGTWEPPIIETNEAGIAEYTFTPDSEFPCINQKTIKVEVTEKEIPEFIDIGPYCENSTPEELPTSSNNYITGEWDPPVINTSKPGIFNFTFIPDNKECAEIKTIEIEIVEKEEPEFDKIGPYCVGVNPSKLPQTSIQGIKGSWHPPEINTDYAGIKNYAFIPDKDECAKEKIIQIKIDERIDPEFDSFGPYYQDEETEELPEISNNGIPGTWHPGEIDTSILGITSYIFTPESEYCANEIIIEIKVYEKTYSIVFEVIDIQENPIDDAYITLNNNRQWPGQYIFSGYLPGLYEYVVRKNGYIDVVDYIAVIEENIVEQVIMIKDPTSINHYTDSNFEIFPNPAKNILNIKSNEIIEHIEFIDISGRHIYSTSTNKTSKKIDLSDFESGIYFLKVATKNKIATEKIQIIK